MALLDLLKVASYEDIDPDRPLEICGLTLGTEAASAAIEVIRTSAPQRPLSIITADVEIADFFELHAEFGVKSSLMILPINQRQSLPTAIEMALVEAFHSATDDQVPQLVSSGCIVNLGSHPLGDKFVDLLKVVVASGSSQINVLSNYKNIHLSSAVDDALNPMDQSCLAGYISASPIKYKFIELYRLMEARYLDHIKNELNLMFMSEPENAVRSALKSRESEMSQIGLLSERATPCFEMIFEAIRSEQTSNRFAASLCRKLHAQGGSMKSPRHKAGAALVYYIRCAIVHSGSKDIIYESFPDSEELLGRLIEHVEEAAFALAGFELRN